MEKDLLKILVVDDEPKDRGLISKSLERSKVPARVEFESSSRGALRLMKKRKFDLVLSDHSPPALNAFHLLQVLSHTDSNTPVIILARDGDARAVREAFKRGAEDYVLKQELDSISLFDVIGSAIEQRRHREEIREAQTRLKHLAERDGLTGLYNHRQLLEILEREFARSKRYYRPLSLLMIDLDGFKSINDTCGHLKGDVVLKQVARLIEKSVRSVDLVARYGGDEFVVLLPETQQRAAIGIGERIVRELKQHPFLDEEKIYPLSASVGIASFSPSMPSIGALIKEADEALYAAKRNGRSQVVYLKSIKSDGSPKKETPQALTT